jgi:hypothetical protein
LFPFAKLGNVTRRFDGDAHDCEWLCRPVLPFAQPTDCCRGCGIGQQLITSDSSHGNNSAAADGVDGAAHSICGRLRSIAGQPQPGSTPGTRDRLCVKAAVSGILVFALAVCTKLESPHRRTMPIKWQRHQDAITRTTLRTRRQQVSESPISRISSLGQTLATDRRVERHGDGDFTLCVGIENLEPPQ